MKYYEGGFTLSAYTRTLAIFVVKGKEGKRRTIGGNSRQQCDVKIISYLSIFFGSKKSKLTPLFLFLSELMTPLTKMNRKKHPFLAVMSKSLTFDSQSHFKLTRKKILLFGSLPFQPHHGGNGFFAKLKLRARPIERSLRVGKLKKSGIVSCYQLDLFCNWRSLCLSGYICTPEH